MSQASDTPSLMTFKEAYDILKHNADSLEQRQTLDIDNLVSVVEQSIDAIKSAKNALTP